jgi:hypothetical protein
MRLRRDSPDEIRQKSSALKAGHKENRMNTLPQDAWRSNICRAKTRNIEPLLIAEWPIQRGEIARDPIDGEMRPVEVVSPNVLWWLLSGAVDIARSLKKLDQRAAAKLIGVSPVSVCRTERGQPVSIEGLLKVYVFIGIRPDAYRAPLTAPPQIVPRGTSTETFCFGSERLPDNVGSANQATAP